MLYSRVNWLAFFCLHQIKSTQRHSSSRTTTGGTSVGSESQPELIDSISAWNKCSRVKNQELVKLCVCSDSWLSPRRLLSCQHLFNTECLLLGVSCQESADKRNSVRFGLSSNSSGNQGKLNVNDSNFFFFLTWRWSGEKLMFVLKLNRIKK